jgi:hypothetical protein
MKHLKTIGVVVVAALALLSVGSGSASATVLCKQQITPCGAQAYANGTEVTAFLKTGTKAVFKTVIWQTVECKTGAMRGKVTSAGGAAATVIVSLESMEFEECTCASGTRTAAITVKTLGTLEIHSITGSWNGTITGSGQNLTFGCEFLTPCQFGTTAGAKDLGTLFGGSPGSLTLAGSVLRIAGDGTAATCGETMEWTGQFDVTKPNAFWVTAS